MQNGFTPAAIAIVAQLKNDAAPAGWAWDDVAALLRRAVEIAAGVEH